ncbi:ankyrin-2-like [Microplitis mediator]|uniref:ankyrin-2-like n=1 Tax=Microplitis mediator TaxID=375433 RepID=UPI002555CCEC|nr:ankyrin-2-like [Microplitis mediator]
MIITMESTYPPIILLETDDTTAFLRAARSGNLEKVVEYLDLNLDINTSNSNGLNALHLASKDGHVEIVTELLKRGAKVDSATKKGNTALHIASLAGQVEVVNILLQYGAAVNTQSQNGFTPLYMAAQENHDQVVKLLLTNGANQSLATEDGFTPLAVAMQQGHDKVVSVLLENDSKGKVRLPALHIAAKKDDCKAADLLLQNDHKPDVTSKSGFTPLHIAAHYGNEEIGRLLIKRGADVNYLAKHNISPLHVAAKWGKNNMVKLLLENSAMIDAKTRDGLTPLHCAARSGHEEVVSTLLEHSAPISARTKNGLAPLHMASQGDHVDAARVLLYHRAPVDEVTIDYLTSLHVAAHCGHVRVAKLLLDRKADPNARALNGFTPLHIACKKNRIKVVELLLKHGASIESTTESGLTPLHVASFMGCMNIVIFLLQHEANPDVPTVRGETPLHLAARANQTDIIRILLRNGAKVDARAREEQTPLHIASRLGNVDIVMLLLQHGASVDTTTKDMYTALHIAAKEGQEEVAGILVENHASVKALTKNGFTPLHIAAKYGNVNVAKILLQKDSKLDSQGKNDITPLHLACHYDHSNVANMILEKGASANLASQNGHTPLHIAARKNQMDIASTLLEHGADPNAQSKAGFTPLQLSAQKGHYDMTNLLIEHGADPNHKSKNGLTALHLCAQEDSIRVASILVKNGANVESQTESGYRPIHVASHFGNLSMIRFLLKHNAQIDVRTSHNYTPLHQAAQQGHAHIVTALLEGNASHNAKTTDGLTALNIAQKLGYISVMEVLKGLDYDTQTPDNKTWEEKYKVIAPESLQETCFMSDSDDEGVSDGLTNEQPYRYLTADIMKSLRDDSLPIDVTRDDPIHRQLSHEEKQEFTQSNNYCPPENFDSTDAINVGRLHFRSFLVSFLVDARGGTMKGCRHSGIRIIVPPGRATMPIRVTCRLLKPTKVANPPALMEGEALATRIIEMGPVGATFLGPVLIDVPHFASIEGKDREIIIMRSENGETWKEHDNSRDNDDTLLNTAHDSQMSTSHSGRITRIITTEFPQYFAIITRIKQEVHVIGADGGILISSVANHVQAVFPPGALTKKIKVGLQAHVIPADLTAKLLGNCVAVSPVITIEPRRRKFHKPITLTIPVPQAANKGMINDYAGETPTLRLLCSIAGGTSEAQWEDVTGSTPLTFLNNRVSFTTTVSARFWLMDCRNISEVPKMATELYKESLFVPFITNFVIYSKRFDVVEATLRILCMTDGKDGLHTLEKQEEFLEIVKSRDVEALDGKDLYLEFSGNLVPVTKSGQQLKFTFKAFRQNRLSFNVKVKDQLLDPVARMMFMREPKVAKGELAQQPICILNIVLPEPTVPKTPSNSKLKELDYDFISKMDIYKSTYMRDYGEKRDIPKPTSPKQQKLISDILDKKQTDAEINESFAQKVASPLESVDASYPNNINDNNVNNKQEELLSPNLEKQTYSEKRKFWEDITRNRDSYQRSESEISRASQMTINESDSDYLQNPISEEEMDRGLDNSTMHSETMEDLNIPDMSECSVAEKAHYFEEQIQKEIIAVTTVSRPVSKLISQDSLPRDKRLSSGDSFIYDESLSLTSDKDSTFEIKKVEKKDEEDIDRRDKNLSIEIKENKRDEEKVHKEEMVKNESLSLEIKPDEKLTKEEKDEKVIEKVTSSIIETKESKQDEEKIQRDQILNRETPQITQNNEKPSEDESISQKAKEHKYDEENIKETIIHKDEGLSPDRPKMNESKDKLIKEEKEIIKDDTVMESPSFETTKMIESEEKLFKEEETKNMTVEEIKKDESLSLESKEGDEIKDIKEICEETKVTIDNVVEQNIKPEFVEMFDTKPSLIPRKIKSEVTTTTSIEPGDKVKSMDKKVTVIEETKIFGDDSIITKQICREFIDSESKLSHQDLVKTYKIPEDAHKVSDISKLSPEDKVSKIPTKIKVETKIESSSFVDTDKDKDKETAKKESKIPIFSAKDKGLKAKDEDLLKDADDKKKKSGIPKRIVETTKVFEKTPSAKEDVITVTETKITEKVSQHIETHTSERKIHSQTITKTFTDPEEALRAFEATEMMYEPETLVTTSKIDHEEMVTVGKKEIKSSEVTCGDEKTLKHEEKEREVREKSSESTVTTESQEETIEDKTFKHETADKSTIQNIEVNLVSGKQMIDARASQELKSLKDEVQIHKVEDDDGVVIQEAGMTTLKEHEIDTAVKIVKDQLQEMEDKEFDMSNLGTSLEDELKTAVIREQTHEESSRHSDTKVFPSRETTEDISRDEAFGEESTEHSEEDDSEQYASGDTHDKTEARDIAETLVQSIEDELEKRSESSGVSNLGFEYDVDNGNDIDDGPESEDFDEQLADDLTKKFENIMGKRKESQVQVIESIEQIRATVFGQDERLDKDSTRGSLSISEDLTKDEDSTPHDREESFLSSSSHAKVMERDVTMSPSSISDQIDLESFGSEQQQAEQLSPMPVIEYPEELKVGEEYFEQPDEYVSPMNFTNYESTGARVLEIIEPSVGPRRGSRQDSVDVSSLEIDELRYEPDDDDEEHSLDEKYMKHLEFGKLHESPALEALDKIGLDRDLTFSPSSMSDSSMIPERSLSPGKVKSGGESEDGGFSSMEPEKTDVVEKVSRLDTKSIDRDITPTVISPRTKLKELNIKPVDWSIGDEKIEIQETLEPSQAFDKELEEYQSSMVKQQSLTSLNDVSGEQESTTRSSEDVSTIESVKEASMELTSKAPTKFIVEPVSESEVEQELVEDKLDVSCQELVATLQREYEAKTPTDEKIPVTPRRVSESEEDSEVVEGKHAAENAEKLEIKLKEEEIIEEYVKQVEEPVKKVEKSEPEEKDIDTLEESEKKEKENANVETLKNIKESFASKTKSLDEPQKHLEKTLDKEKFGAMSIDSSPFRLKKEPNVDLSARYAITVLDQVVKREIEEVKESLEAAKQDLIEELSENSETIVQIKESPSEFQFKLEPESIPNDLPFLYKAPSFEQAADQDLTSSGSPVAKPRKHDTQDDESLSEKRILSDKDDTLSELPSDKPTEIKVAHHDDETEKSGPIPASRSSSDVENRDDGSSSLSVPPQPIPRKRQKPARISKKIHSESEGGSSSGESSNYQSCDYETNSRPSSSDIEVLQTASGFLSATASEYETAMMSLESSKQTSQDYQSAVSTLSSRESMKSLNSLSSGHLGSIDSTSELTETLVASEPEMDKDQIDENLELALDNDDEKSSVSSDSDIPLDDTLDNLTGDIPSKMKRSSEMIFQQISEDADTSLPEALEGSTTEEGQSTKVTSSIIISEDDDLKTSTIDAISDQISFKAEESSSPEFKYKSIEAQSTGDDIDSSELKMSSLTTIDEVENLLLTKRSVLQQASMSTSSTSGVSIETVVEREVDRHSPDSDSFELVDKPDIIDDFVVVEEVGREAEEFDSEGKSISIKAIPASNIKKFDRDLENLITDTKKDAPTSSPALPKNNELFDFESEESPPQASNEDQSSQQSFSDDEQEAKKWMEMQFTADPRAYEVEYDRGPLEDIKEEEITDFEAGSSRFGSLGSHKGSIGSSGSMKGSLGTEYDILAGKKMFSKSVEHDNISMNSLQEFESLESTVIDNAKKFQCGSQDSVNNGGSLPRRYIASRSGHGDDISVSSLTDFEGLEKACREAHMIELRAKEEEDLLDHESPENRYRLENLPKPKPAADTSAAGSFNPSTSGSDDYEKRIMEIDEIIRIAQANVEKFDRQDDTTEDISQIDITDAEKVETIIPQGPQAEIELPDVRDLNIMETSTDSLELEDPDKHNNLMCRSSDSLEMKTTVDFPSLSYSDSLNNVRDSQDQYMPDQFNSSRRISSDSLEVQVIEQPDNDDRHIAEGSNYQLESKITNNGKTTTTPATTHA